MAQSVRLRLFPRTFVARLARRVRGRIRSDDDGFGLVEVVVASGVILTSLTMMAGVLTSGLTSTAVSKERQAATGLANQTLEKVRALPFETLRRGLDATEVANSGDPNVTTCSGNPCFQGERIVTGTNATVDPLVPHRTTVTHGDATEKQFTIGTYVTYYQNSLTANAYRVTAIVSWTSNVRNGKASSIDAQTIIFPNGCLSLPAHPYSGPCQASFTGSAIADRPTITVDGQVAPGVHLVKAVLSGVAASSDVNTEQTSRVEGITQGAGATLQPVSGAEQTIGYASVPSQADNDPEATKGILETNDLPSAAPASASVAAGVNSSTVALAAGSGGRTTSTTAADAMRACPNLPSPSTVPNETDSQPCGGSSTQTGATPTMSTTIDGFGALGLGEVAQATPTDTTIDRRVATNVDVTQSKVSRSALNMKAVDVSFLGASFDHFLKIQSYSAAAQAEAGVGSTATALTTSGTLSYLKSAGAPGTYTYENVSLSTDASVTIPSLALTVGSNVIELGATVTAGSRSYTTTPSSCSGTCTRTATTAKITPPTVTITMRIIPQVGDALADLSITINPGTIQAKASYVAAPTS
jgi:Tfp pilus assembly protein PilV